LVRIDRRDTGGQCPGPEESGPWKFPRLHRNLQDMTHPWSWKASMTALFNGDKPAAQDDPFVISWNKPLVVKILRSHENLHVEGSAQSKLCTRGGTYCECQRDYTTRFIYFMRRSRSISTVSSAADKGSEAYRQDRVRESQSTASTCYSRRRRLLIRWTHAAIHSGRPWPNPCVTAVFFPIAARRQQAKSVRQRVEWRCSCSCDPYGLSLPTASFDLHSSNKFKMILSSDLFCKI
jgi:hypothetical protein